MPQVSDQEVVLVRKWLDGESHLPKDISNNMLKKFIFSCDNNLDKAKKCIDKFCSYRASMREVYHNRDPASEKMQKSFSIINVSWYDAGPNEIVIHQLHATWDNVDFYDTLMSFTMFADLWINRPTETLYEGHIIILDIKEFTLLLITRCNVFYFQKFIVHLLESMPVLLKAIHVVNCPSFTQYMYNLVKGALPEEIQNIVKFHTTTDGLHDHIDKKYLPLDYGGSAPSLSEEHQCRVTEVMERRDMFTNNNLWKADIANKKKKCAEKVKPITSSFKVLAID